MDNQDIVQLAKEFTVKTQSLKQEIAKVVVGQDEVVDALITAIFCHGHVLMVGVPGLAKTLLVKTLSQSMHLDFRRIQFTPDLMPSDIIGSEILDDSRKFVFIKGPIFTNVVLADEINRTPPKTQAALLEAMQERQVTAAGKEYNLDEPFFVLATQNPIEQEGTYPLPEAQLDRFMFQVNLNYPKFDEEVSILKQTTGSSSGKSEAILDATDIMRFQKLVREVPVPHNVFEMTVRLVHKTRPSESIAPEVTKKYISFGAGPRAGQNLILAAKCKALMRGKFSVDYEDVAAVSRWVLRHRIVRNFKAEAEGISADSIIDQLVGL
ncbi:MAG: AAA family ATPase [Sediminibacterium sp.]|nr:AAA family ATPase [Sediminibacterium sp.]